MDWHVYFGLFKAYMSLKHRGFLDGSLSIESSVGFLMLRKVILMDRLYQPITLQQHILRVVSNATSRNLLTLQIEFGSVSYVLPS